MQRDRAAGESGLDPDAVERVVRRAIELAGDISGDVIGRGGDDTLYALIEGRVQYGTKRGRRNVSVFG